MSLTTEIKEHAAYLGYTKAGVTTADDFTEFIEDLQSRGDPYHFMINGPLDMIGSARPRSKMPEAKSIIVLALDYIRSSFPEELTGLISRVYQARSHSPLPESVDGARFKLMKTFLEEKGLGVRTDISLPYRQAALRAGIADFGRNALAYADGAGSFITLYVFVVDKELEYDEPSPKSKCPSNCRLCMDSCPAGALYEPYKLNPKRCVNFSNIMTLEGREAFGISTCIPAEMRGKLGRRIHGCDVCQEVCPRNKASLERKLPPDTFLETIAKDLTLENILRMDDDFYRRRLLPITYNYSRDPRYLRRNAAVALGNLKDTVHVPGLRTALLGDPAEMVRAHAAWALGRIGGSEAKAALQAALAAEASGWVREEVTAALTDCLH